MKRIEALSFRLPDPIVLDLAERILVASLVGFFALRMLTLYVETGTPHYLLLLFSEGVAFAFVLFRRLAREVSTSPAEWLVAALGTVLPLLAVAGGNPVASAWVSGLLMFAGIVMNTSAKLSLRRSFGVVPANRGVKVNGPYGLVRHPMYLGYATTQLGFVLLHPSLWNLAIYGVAWSLQIARILAEERVLSADPAYARYKARVRYRLLPGVF